MKFLPEAELDTVISGHVARHLARVEDGVAGHSQLSVRQGHGHNTSPGRGGSTFKLIGNVKEGGEYEKSARGKIN